MHLKIVSVAYYGWKGSVAHGNFLPGNGNRSILGGCRPANSSTLVLEKMCSCMDFLWENRVRTWLSPEHMFFNRFRELRGLRGQQYFKMTTRWPKCGVTWTTYYPARVDTLCCGHLTPNPSLEQKNTPSPCLPSCRVTGDVVLLFLFLSDAWQKGKYPKCGKVPRAVAAHSANYKVGAQGVPMVEPRSLTCCVHMQGRSGWPVQVQ